MADKIVLSFTKGQYRRLLDMVYLGNTMLSASEKYNEEACNQVESVVFSKVAQIGRPQYAENIEDYGGWMPTREYEQKGVIASMEEYDDAMFWENLIHKLALKDVAQFADVNNPDILFSAIDQRMEQYREYFDEHGFSKIKVEGIEEFTIPDTFRTMNVGEIDMDAFVDYDEEDDE